MTIATNEFLRKPIANPFGGSANQLHVCTAQTDFLVQLTPYGVLARLARLDAAARQAPHAAAVGQPPAHGEHPLVGVDKDHPDMQLNDDQVRELVSERAYEATDS